MELEYIVGTKLGFNSTFLPNVDFLLFVRVFIGELFSNIQTFIEILLSLFFLCVSLYSTKKVKHRIHIEIKCCKSKLSQKVNINNLCKVTSVYGGKFYWSRELPA